MNISKLSSSVVVCAGLAGATFAADPFAPGAAGNPNGAANSMILNLTSQAVVDAAGQPAGTLDYVLVSPSGCIDLGLVMIAPQKVVAVPWQFMNVQSTTQGTLTPTGRTAPQAPFRLTIESARMRQAPSFAANQLNSAMQPSTIPQVYDFYGLPAPNQQNTSGSLQQTNGSRTAPAPSPPDQQLNTNLPPGLQRRETLPPGLDRRDTLPPGLQRTNQGPRVPTDTPLPNPNQPGPAPQIPR